MPPTTQLQPGATGPEVLKLQQYLVSQGVLTPQQMNTGPGIYGPYTTAAVKALQQKLGVDNSSGPGYWGPRTIAAVSGSSTPAPQPQPQPQQQAPTTSPWNNIAKQDPIVNTLLSDPSKQTIFDTLPDDMKLLFTQTASSLSKAIEAGKVVNPAIEITPTQVKQFYDQAATEIDPYYTESFNTLRGNLDLSLGRMAEDYARTVQRSEDPFKQALAAQAETEADQGTAFSSERNRREATTVRGQNDALGDAFRTTQRSAQDLLRGYEGSVGTDKARAVALPTLTQYSANTGGYTSDASRTIDPGLLGGISYGSVGAARETALRTRASDLEKTYRQNRILDYSPL